MAEKKEKKKIRVTTVKKKLCPSLAKQILEYSSNTYYKLVFLNLVHVANIT